MHAYTINGTQVVGWWVGKKFVSQVLFDSCVRVVILMLMSNRLISCEGVRFVGLHCGIDTIVYFCWWWTYFFTE